MSTGLITTLWVLLWASAFITARATAPHADPLTFLAIRFAVSCLVFAALARLAGAAWPRDWRTWRDQLIVGGLIHGLYLSAMFWAMWHGLPGALAALVGGVQPIVSAALAPLVLGERVRALQWLGIGLGFAGLALAVTPGLGTVDGLPVPALISAFAGMLSFTAGTIWQKRGGGAVDLRVGATIQFIAGTAITAPAAALLEHGRFDNGWIAWASMVWCVLGISVGATTLLLILIKQGAVSKVTAMLYLVPPAAAVLGYLLLGEALTVLQLGGLAVAAVGVLLANRAAPA